MRDLARLERKGIEVVTAEVESLDPDAKTVRAGGREIGGDHMVVSLGAALAPENVPGLAEAGHNLYSLEGATSIRDLRTTVTDGRIVVLIAGLPFKCPAAPYEAAMLLDDDAKKRKVRDRVEIAVYSPEAGRVPDDRRAAGTIKPTSPSRKTGFQLVSTRSSRWISSSRPR